MANDSNGITVERLRELLSYDPETGVFLRRVRTSNRITVGQVAGRIDNRGYRRIRLESRAYQAHRLAWLYVYGSWPMYEIDHIDGVRSNNALKNLRDVNRRMNSQNHRRSPRGKSAGILLGTSFSPKLRRWIARIRIDGKSTYLGSFETEEQAHDTYVQAKRRFHAGCTI